MLGVVGRVVGRKTESHGERPGTGHRSGAEFASPFAAAGFVAAGGAAGGRGRVLSKKPRVSGAEDEWLPKLRRKSRELYVFRK